MSNETSGEHYTPRDIVNLLVSLVFTSEKENLSRPNKIVSLYDPCCGTGGMLTVGKKWIKENISKDVERYLSSGLKEADGNGLKLSEIRNNLYLLDKWKGQI